MADLDARSDAAMLQAKRVSRFGAASARTYKVVTTWSAAAAGLAALAVLAFAVQADDGFRVFATGMVVAAASAFTGALFGFIFGVPRVLTSDYQKAEGRTPNRVAAIVANTNLEQISDWLTKIIIGVGLTQFGPIAKAAGDLFNNLAPSFGGQETGAAFAGGLVLYMLTFGFATGWLFTRLFLGRAMAAADRSAAALDLMELADEAQRTGDEDAARVYLQQARGLLETTASADKAEPKPAAAPDAPSVYRTEVMIALGRLSRQLESPVRLGPVDTIDAVVGDPRTAYGVNIIIRYRQSGSLAQSDLQRIARGIASLQAVSSAVVVVTNAALSESFERRVVEIPGDPRLYVVVTWNGQGDDGRLAEAITWVRARVMET